MKSYNIKFALSALLMVLFASLLKAQPVLDTYIKDALQSNNVLQQKNLSLQHAQQSLRIASSYFLPNVSLLGDYTTGKGGRSIEMPIGDLLNPVYASLNQLTGSDEFPQIENVEQNFFPRNFYDARIRTSVPLINTDLHVNRRIVGQQVLLKEYEVEIYKRDLILQVKSSYYNYLSALAAVKIYESALQLVEKNHEINQALLNNGKSLPANVLRSKSEFEKVKAELNSARSKVAISRKYFNFLLNRDLTSEILVDDNITIDETEALSASAQNREELSMLRSVSEIQKSQLDLYRLSRLPKLSAFVDVGSQASDWKVSSDSRYYLAGVQLTVPLFQGFRNNAQIRQARLNVQRSSLELQNSTSQLAVAEDIARENYSTALQNLSAAREQVKASRSYFNLMEKAYQQGVNSLIEFIDARNQLTASELQLNLRQYELLTAAAQLERETSSFNLPQ
jgi:outer membrane protein